MTIQFYQHLARQNINKEQQSSLLNNTVGRRDLTDNYKTRHLTTAEYTFSSSAHRILSRVEHMLNHEASLNKFKETEVISNLFSDYSDMKLKSIIEGKH